ncbi:MAG TPA: CapA family protein, partial [Anaerolineaceae bacterium]|nr:CapA family protein [Anaerolineaceae bacterium]
AQIYGIDVVPLTLDLYRQAGMVYYGGGSNLAEARSPAVIEHNGNRLAFVGCNPSGPDYAWATESGPGAAPCEDLQWMQAEVARLRQEGILPIATFQWFENYSNSAGPEMERDLRSMAEAGAIIVNGSQAHTPKEMEFHADSFIHYGLGNLFFDQMHVDLSYLQIGQEWVPATRLEFIDRHVIYAGRLISTELLTAMLEEYAKPRPMTAEERAAFLQDIFTAAGW